LIDERIILFIYFIYTFLFIYFIDLFNKCARVFNIYINKILISSIFNVSI